MHEDEITPTNEPHMNDGDDDKSTKTASSTDSLTKGMDVDNNDKAYEEEKLIKKQIIQDLRKDYVEILHLNSELPKAYQLSRDQDLNIDKEYNEMMQKQHLVKLAEIKKEHARESERKELLRRKIEAEYVDPLKYERVVISGLKEPEYKIQTFVTTKLSSFVENYTKNHIQSKAKQENTFDDVEDPSNSSGNSGHPLSSSATDEANGKMKIEKLSPSNNKQKENTTTPQNENVVKKQSTFEARKQMRKERTAEKEKLYRQKPDPDGVDDPRDVLAIRKVEENLGCYNVKSSKDYKVPEGKSNLTAQKKLEEAILLEFSLYERKCSFNEKVLELRENKKSVVRQISQENRRIRTINGILQLNDTIDELWESTQSIKEFPESRNIVTETEIQNYLKNGTVERVVNEDNDHTHPSHHSPVSVLKSNKFSKDFIMKETESYKLSQFEKDQNEITRMTLLHEKKVILSKKEEMVRQFDRSLRILRKESFQLATELKLDEARLMTLVEEVKLLRGFETKEEMLNNKLQKSMQSKKEILTSIQEYNNKLEEKQMELDSWIEKDQQIKNQFLERVPESHPFYPELRKSFFRRVRRRQNNNENSDGEDSEDEWDSDESDDDYDDYDDDSEDEEYDDTCPEGCEEDLYDFVLELRDKRLDQEAILSTFKKEMEELKRMQDRYLVREKQIEKEFKATRDDIQKFQSKKQQKINQIYVTIPIRADKIYMFEDKNTIDNISASDNNATEVSTRPPTTSSTGSIELISEESNVKVSMPKPIKTCITGNESIVFSKTILEKQRARVTELKEETLEDIAEFKELQKEKVRLEKEISVVEEKVEQRLKDCEELQMLRFGQLVDINALDKLTVSSTKGAELEVIALEKMRAHEKELELLLEKQNNLKHELHTQTIKNTSMLQEIGRLSERQIFLEKEINQNNASSKNDDCSKVGTNGSKVKETSDEEELNVLREIVNQQSEDLRLLKDEILYLKGGQKYVPSC